MKSSIQLSLREIHLILLILLALTLSVSTLSLNSNASWSGKTIIIRANGTVEPSDAPIKRNGEIYFLIDDIEITSGDGIIIERDNIVLDGNNHYLKGGSGYLTKGIFLNNKNKVKIKNMRIRNFSFGILLVNSSNNEIVGNVIENNEGSGIFLLSNSSNNKIVENVIENNKGSGIEIATSPNNEISRNAIKNNEVSLHFWDSSENKIVENTIENNEMGIYLTGSKNKVVGNRFIGCGMEVWDSYDNFVKDNTVNNKPLVYLENEHGKTIREAGQVILVKCSNIIVENLNLSKASVGVQLFETKYSIIRNNIIEGNVYAINTWGSSENEIVGNIIENNEMGIYLTGSKNKVVGNRFIGCGMEVWDSYDNFVKDNTVNNKPLVYLENEHGKTIREAGQVILVKCSNIIVENLNLSKASVGVQLWHTENSTIRTNSLEDNKRGGILLGDSSNNNEVIGNNLKNNKWGILVGYSSNNNKIIGNNIEDSELSGITLWGSSDNEIKKNTIKNSKEYGIVLGDSSNNKIHLNNFINNRPKQVLISISDYSNSWDDGSKGNYWDDYNGADINNDGLGDTPYIIDENNKDKCPLMSPYECFLINVMTSYGVSMGSGLYERGVLVTVSISETTINHGNGTRRIFTGWYEASKLISYEQSFSITVDRPRNIVAGWITEYEVSISSPCGSVNGLGWYAKGSSATVSVSPTVFEKDFFTNVVFEGWRLDGSIVSTSPTYSFVVDRPVTLVASWKTEVKLFAIGVIMMIIFLFIVAVVFLVRRKPLIERRTEIVQVERKDETKVVTEEASEEYVKKLEEELEKTRGFLAKLEEERKKGAVSEQAYEVLKKEYQTKIKRLEGEIEKLKK
ncbi:MAG: NosD domain-containing protein [Candidatus Bathyarchaeia archaeon]